MGNNKEISEHPRKLTTEEVYQHIYKQYKAAKFEIGQLKSEIDELKYEREQVEKLLEQLKTADKETIQAVRSEKMYRVITDHNKKLEKRIHNLRQANEELIIKLNRKNKTNGPA